VHNLSNKNRARDAMIPPRRKWRAQKNPRGAGLGKGFVRYPFLDRRQSPTVSESQPASAHDLRQTIHAW